MLKMATGYYDILLLGATGMGKSTVGNKLLGAKDEDERLNIKQFLSAIPGLVEHDTLHFLQADDFAMQQRAHSITQRCQVLSNEKACSVNGEVVKLRVVDARGFSDSNTLSKSAGMDVGVQEGNLYTIRCIVRVQAEFSLTFRRILYFVPNRGPLEKASGVFQQELEVLYQYFGRVIFDSMVLIGTTHHRNQKEFQAEDISETKSAFEVSAKEVFSALVPCPPVVYLGFLSEGTKILSDIASAKVANDKGMKITIREDKCIKCAVSIQFAKREKVSVTYRKDRIVPYELSKCHPGFENKHYVATKLVGGIVHIATAGIPYVIGKATGWGSWPGFTNSAERCIHCHQSPGSTGCLKIGTPTHKGDVVDHTHKI